VSAPQKPPSEVRKNTAAPRHKKKRAKDPLKKRAIKRGKEKPAKKLLEKSLAPPPAKKPDKKREEPVPPVKKREERPMILDKKASEKKAKREKPPIPVPAPAKRAELPVAEQRPEPRAVPEPEALPAPEIPEKAEQTASVPPVAAEEPVEEPLEIEVGNGGLAADGVAEDADDELGVSRDEYALMGAVERAWRPPRGLKPGLAARLTVTVSAQGRADQVAIVVSSRVPAYDIAARAALYRAEYPPVFWGKSIAVVFGQEWT
jgi:colicin import membrane protein